MFKYLPLLHIRKYLGKNQATRESRASQLNLINLALLSGNELDKHMKFRLDTSSGDERN